MSDPTPAVLYRFGRFEFQPGERRLLDAGQAVPITPRASDLLAALLARAGHVLTKDELLALVWPKVIVEEAALQMQVSALRKLLGRDAIATVTGRGYRFVPVVTALDAEAPAPAAAPRHNLPQPLTTFIGREVQISDLQALLGRTRLLTLTGTGGCGKTRLALQLALDLRGAYRDGIWLVELASLADPALLPQAVAQVLGLEEQPGQPLAQTIAEHLAPRQVLMVLDNAEHVLEACAQLVDVALRAGATPRVVVTSRERLGIVGELVYRVPSLSVPGLDAGTTAEPLTANESARLFIDRAQLQQPQFAVTPDNVAALASICRHLDGIPLAIELAAARVRSMPVEEIHRRLDQRFELLTGGSRTALARHQTLRSLIDWSYDLLNAAERLLLSRAAVFPGGWTLEAAQQVCADNALDAKDLLDLLTSLADKSLVIAKAQGGTTRYGLLETVRYYARDRLAELGEEETLARRHFDHVLALVKGPGFKLADQGHSAWMARLEAEHDSLRSALAWSCTSGTNAVDGLHLAAALGRFWRARGHLSEGRRWLSALIAAAPSGCDSPDLAEALRWSAVLAIDQVDHPTAQQALEDALAICRRNGDQKGVARMLNNLGILAGERADHVAARRLFEEGMLILRALNDPQGTSMALTNLGVVTHLLGDHAAAQSLYEQALEIERPLGDRGTIAMLANNVGQTLYLQGDYPRARAMLKEALALWSALGDKFWLVSSLESFATLALLESQPERAVVLFGCAQQLHDEVGLVRTPQAQADMGADLDAARAALGPGVFERAWAEGRATAPAHITQVLLES